MTKTKFQKLAFMLAKKSEKLDIIKTSNERLEVEKKKAFTVRFDYVSEHYNELIARCEKHISLIDKNFSRILKS